MPYHLPRTLNSLRPSSTHRHRVCLSPSLPLLDVQQVLGSGSFGVVYLCRTPSSSSPPFALKVEPSPTPTLTWECLCLAKAAAAHTTPIRPLALHLYDDGAALSMPAGHYGTLQGLVWFYQKNRLMPSLPEALALHYTAQMIHAVLSLHHDTHLLHLDIKPDNWLLWGQDGQGLALIDFGLAVDLSAYSDKQRFLVHDQDCPWESGREEVDYWGLASTAHGLLFGQHLKGDRRGSTTTTITLRRYWQRDLWRRFFDATTSTTTTPMEERRARLEGVHRDMTSYLSQSSIRQQVVGELKSVMPQLLVVK